MAKGGMGKNVTQGATMQPTGPASPTPQTGIFPQTGASRPGAPTQPGSHHGLGLFGFIRSGMGIPSVQRAMDSGATRMNPLLFNPYLAYRAEWKKQNSAPAPEAQPPVQPQPTPTPPTPYQGPMINPNTGMPI